MIFKRDPHELHIARLESEYVRRSAQIAHDTGLLEIEFEKKKLAWEVKLQLYERETLNQLKRLEHEYHSASEELNKIKSQVEFEKKKAELYESKFNKLLQNKDEQIDYLTKTIDKLIDKISPSTINNTVSSKSS